MRRNISSLFIPPIVPGLWSCHPLFIILFILLLCSKKFKWHLYPRNDMHNNPLHVPVSASSSYSAITGALDLPSFSRANSVRLPQTFYTPSNFGMPRPVIDRPIRFDWYGASGQGVPMRNFIAGGPDLYRCLDGANDVVFPRDTKRILLAIKVWTCSVYKNTIANHAMFCL